MCLFVQALLASAGQDRSTGLEAHLVSANSRYIQEQQEQQQVEREGGRVGGGNKRNDERAQELEKEKKCSGVKGRREA